MSTTMNVIRTVHRKKMGRKLVRLFPVFVILLAYPVCVIAYIWCCVLRSDFEGGRHGQLDAYRHALASATVSYTLGEWAVSLTTLVFESGGKDSNKMDIHNNRIGAKIGARADSFRDIETAVRQSVLGGEVGATEPDQVTWLPRVKWRGSKLW